MYLDDAPDGRALGLPARAAGRRRRARRSGAVARSRFQSRGRVRGPVRTLMPMHQSPIGARRRVPGAARRSRGTRSSPYVVESSSPVAVDDAGPASARAVPRAAREGALLRRRAPTSFSRRPGSGRCRRPTPSRRRTSTSCGRPTSPSTGPSRRRRRSRGCSGSRDASPRRILTAAGFERLVDDFLALRREEIRRVSRGAPGARRRRRPRRHPAAPPPATRAPDVNDRRAALARLGDPHGGDAAEHRAHAARRAARSGRSGTAGSGPSGRSPS